MPTDLRETRSLESRPRLKSTCIQLKEIAAALEPESKLPTMAALREQLGVSVYTLNDAVRELERRQILRSVNGVGIFVTGRKRMLTGNIGILGSSSLHSPQDNYYSLFMRGLEKSLVSAKQHLLFLGTEKTWNVQSCEKVDGIILAGADRVEPVIRRIPAALPVVTALTATNNTPSVTVDDYQGARLAVQYLHRKKHQRIACLMEKLPMLSRRRFAGYQDAQLEGGFEINPEWIRLTDSVDVTKDERPYLTWGREQMKKWLREGWSKTNCTAIFVQNDTAAIGVMQVLQEEGVQVPRQVSVIGFDGTQICDYVSPRLCAVEVPLVDIGAKAMELLNQQISNAEVRPSSIVLPLRIREGESVAPPA